VLAQGFLDLGLLQGSLDGVLESGSYRQFYMHRTGHWLGLDVHDAGEYKLAASGACCPRQRAHRRARRLHPPRRRRAGSLLEHRHPHRGRRPRHRHGCDIITIATPKTSPTSKP
jgi:hypothetical protein